MSSFAARWLKAIVELAMELSMLTYTTKLQVVKFWADEHGQDLIEYALMAGFVAVAAGALMPGVATSISIIMSKVGLHLSRASTQGS
jgi:pilus assembly protein Flp/PilA